MKKIILLLLIFIAALSVVSAADVTTYTGAGSAIPSDNLSMTFVLDSNQALGNTQNSSATPQEFFWYGFYTAEADVSSTTSGSTTTTTLTFKESPKSINATDITYSASASFTIYAYILSNSKYKLTLTWTDLKYRNSDTDEISYTIEGITSGTSFYTFDPASGIFVHKDWTFNAKTADYTISTSSDSKVYTGTMTLKMESTT